MSPSLDRLVAMLAAAAVLALATAAASQPWPLPEPPAPKESEDAAEVTEDAAEVTEDTDGAASSARDWNLCRVDVSVLVNAEGASRVVREETRQLFHGDELFFEGKAEAALADGRAVVEYEVRLRAAMLKSDGVVHHLTSSARLVSSVGFRSDMAGRDEVRHAYLEINDPSTRLHELFALPDPSLRVLFAVSVQPTDTAAPETGPRLGEPIPDEFHDFEVEVLLREDEDLKVMDRTKVTTGLGRVASYTLSQVAAKRRSAGDPERRLGERVKVRDLGTLPDSGFGEGRLLERDPADLGWHDAHAEVADDDFLREHVVEIDDEDEPRHVSVRRTKKKIGRRKLEKLRRQQEIVEAAQRAARLARTLPEGERVPEGFRREELTLEIEPRHVSDRWMQADIRLTGMLRIPGEEELTPVALSFVEQLRRGEPFEIAVGELVRGGAVPYDYVFRLTPSP